MRRLLAVFAILGLALGLAAVWVYQDWQRFADQPVNPDSELRLWLPSGTSFPALVRQLEALGLASSSSWHWQVWRRLHAPALKAGEYRIPAGQRIEELVRMLESGRIVEHRFTIVDGWTVARLRRELASDPRLRHVVTDLEDGRLMERLGCAACPAEGRFLPETYFFTRGSTDLELLQRAHHGMNEALARAWAERQQGLPLATPDELLVLASIIERETGKAEERARVAGVFIRRLELGMRLQTDPTVIYGMGDDFDGRLLRVHLRIDHPWNTYTRHGLPPTAIALPGWPALQAAANPAPGTALYFVARGDGSHHFSDTLEEHNRAVNRYIRGRR
ncbi:MAG: endolytic transglycosylase MltG [Wenzhouxiangella sp.]|nr:MAG: endolytic transglycosylase MltG [Wenzhouxiangella sp.]